MKHVLNTDVTLPLPIEEVFAFFARAENLEAITPPELRFRIVSPTPIDVREGALIDYRLSLFGISFGWRTRICSWDPPNRFVDEQLRGPYREWHHTHYFETVPGGTRMRDVVRYQLPFSPLGDLAFPIVRRQLKRIFDHREQAMRRLLLGEAGGAADS